MSELVIENLKKTFKKRLNITEATIADDTGEITATWFHQPYISKLLTPNEFVRLEGKISERRGKHFLSNPKFDKINQLSFRGSLADIPLPIYPATIS